MKYRLSLVLAALVGLFTSCEHKPLILPDADMANVKIVLDWSEVDEEDIPENVTLHFYPEAGTRLEKIISSDQEEQTVAIPYGVYQLLVTAGSEEVTTTHPGTWRTHSLTLNQSPEGLVGHLLGNPSTAYAEPQSYPQPLGYSLAPVYAAIIERVVTSEAAPLTTVIVKPRRVTARYNITVNNFNVDTRLAKVWGGAISGVNGALLPGETLFSDHCRPAVPTPVMTQPFTLLWNGSTTATATAYTFGTPEHEQRQLIYLYIWSDEQSLLTRSYDVTGTIAAAPDPMNVDIVINFQGFTSDDGSPYAPGVSDFEDDEEQIIKM